MKRFSLFTLAALLLMLAACGERQPSADSGTPQDTTPPSLSSAPTESEPAALPSDESTLEPSEETDAEQEESDMEGYTIKMTVGDTELTAVLEDNSTTQALVEQMPMTLPMMDLYGREMCYRYGGGALPTDDLRSDRYEVGDLAYWPPAGSLVILYKQNGEQFERQHLGHIDEGVDVFDGIGDVDVTFELAEGPADRPEADVPRESADTPASTSQEQVSAAPQPTPTPTPTQSPQEPEQKILIAYFTWADNTSVEDPSSVDPTIDAPSSASILPPGDTARLAGWIQQEVGGDLHSIITEEPYSSDYDDCLDRAIDEQDRGIRPALSSSVSNMDDYDIVFLGYPNWWYSCPMAILTFIEENDLSGKTIIPFCAPGTGGLASSLRDIKAALPSDCTVLKEFDVYRADVRSAQSDVQAWLRDLDL